MSGATAALLLLTLVAGYIAVIRPMREMRPQAGIISASALESTFELRGQVDMTLPLSSWTGIARDYLDPGANMTLQDGRAAASAVSPTFIVVEAGRLEVHAAGPMAVRPAGESNLTTPVAAGETVTLEAGDGAVIAPQVAIELHNPGPDPVRAINADVIQVNSGPAGPGFSFSILSDRYNAPIPVPGAMVLRRKTLAPGESLSAPQKGVVQLVAAAVPLESRPYTTDGSYPNQTKAPLDVYVLTFEPRPAPSATPAAGVGTVTP